MDSAQDGIISIDHTGVILEFNPAAERIFGYTREQVMGKEMAELIVPPSLREGHRRGLAHYLATGEGPVLGRRLELTAQRADGTEFPVELSITRIGSDEPPTFTGFVRDITERKRARTELERQQTELQLILDAVPAMVFYKDRQHRHVRVNQSLVRLHGLTKDAIEGRTDKDMGSPHAERYYRDDDEVMTTGRPNAESSSRWKRPAARTGWRRTSCLIATTRGESSG